MDDPSFPPRKFHYEGMPSPEPRRQNSSLTLWKNSSGRSHSSTGFVSAAARYALPRGWVDGSRGSASRTLDSHINAYVSLQTTPTEVEPGAVKPYAEGGWAELDDSKCTPIEISLVLLESLHLRWVRLLRSLNEADWKRTFRHPELGVVELEKSLALCPGMGSAAPPTSPNYHGSRWAGKRLLTLLSAFYSSR